MPCRLIALVDEIPSCSIILRPLPILERHDSILRKCWRVTHLLVCRWSHIVRWIASSSRSLAGLVWWGTSAHWTRDEAVAACGVVSCGRSVQKQTQLPQKEVRHVTTKWWRRMIYSDLDYLDQWCGSILLCTSRLGEAQRSGEKAVRVLGVRR
jgi:hypothetical protein